MLLVLGIVGVGGTGVSSFFSSFHTANIIIGTIIANTINPIPPAIM
jgi:hypothetical protein